MAGQVIATGFFLPGVPRGEYSYLADERSIIGIHKSPQKDKLFTDHQKEPNNKANNSDKGNDETDDSQNSFGNARFVKSVKR